MVSALWNKVNTKRLWPTALAVFGWVFISDMVIHGWWLSPDYKATAHLWRSETEMGQFMGWMFAGQAMTAFMLSFIFTKGYEGKGWKEGARYGFLMGLFVASQQCITYAVSPLPSNIFWSWIWTGLAQSVIAGIVASWIYKSGKK